MFEPIEKSEVKTVPFDPVKVVTDFLEQGKLADSEIYRADSLRCLGMVCCELGHYLNAGKSFEESLRIYCSLPDTDIEQVICTIGLGVTYRETGRLHEAEEILDKTLRVL